MLKRILMIFLLLLAAPLSVGAVGITNGDFETGDFSGWRLDTDGLPGDTSTDFFVIDLGGNKSARIEADYFSNQAWFANTLYQEIDLFLPDLVNDYSLNLSFSYSFDGEDGDSKNEYLVVGINDGTGTLYNANGSIGYLLETDVYGSGYFNTTLNNDIFANKTGWFLDFQLNIGSDYDWYGSYVLIDDVNLEAIPLNTTPVPEPTTLITLSIGVIGLCFFRRFKKESFRFYFLIAFTLLLCPVCQSHAAMEWEYSEIIKISKDDRPYLDRVNQTLNINIYLTNNGNLSLWRPVRIKILNSSHELVEYDGLSDDNIPYIEVNDFGQFWAVGENRVFQLKFKLQRGALTVETLAEIYTPVGAIRTTIENFVINDGLDLFRNASQDYLKYLYDRGTKLYLTISSGPEFGVQQFNGSINFDLMDFMGVTQEGRDGWVTYTLDGSYGLGWSSPPPYEMPVTFSVTIGQFNSSEPDVAKSLGFSLIDISSPIPFWNCSLITGSLSQENGNPGFELADEIQPFTGTLSATILNTTFTAYKGEIRREYLDFIIGSLANQIRPGIGLHTQIDAVKSLWNKIDIESDDFSGNPLMFRKFSSLDDGTPASYEAIINRLLFVEGGRNQNTDYNIDCNGDVIFPIVDDSFFNQTTWDAQRLVLGVLNTGGNTSAYNVKVVSFPEGWVVGSMDINDLNPIPSKDHTYHLEDVVPRFASYSQWAIGATEGAVLSGQIKFEVWRSGIADIIPPSLHPDIGEEPLATYTINVVAEPNACINGNSFSDDFSSSDFNIYDGDFSNWEFFKYSSGLHGPVIDPTIIDGKVHIYTRDQQSTLLINGDESWSNYTIEAEVTVERAYDDIGRWIGLEFYLNDFHYHNNYFSRDSFAFGVTGRDRIWRFQRVHPFESGRSSDLLASGGISITNGVSYIMKATIHGDTADLYFYPKSQPEVKLATVDISGYDLASGRFGFTGGDDEITIDNVRVYTTP